MECEVGAYRGMIGDAGVGCVAMRAKCLGSLSLWWSRMRGVLLL